MTEYNLREAKIISKNGQWYVYLCIQKEKEYEKSKSVENVLANRPGTWLGILA